ncbi:hypothetical protein FS837_002226 [Tulasnella sp. UAMH 9824]|nr:hypothetical protein FS837_002226 [Tulasnella sp. UAMH 9824]
MPPTRSNTSATLDASPSPEPQSSKEVPERSRNAKAQARHREKRKAYISHLEQSVASLKQQLASMGISGAIPAHALNGGTSSSPVSQSETDARLRELVEENERLKAEIQRLRARVESMGGSAASGGSSSRSSTGGHHGLTPPATPSVLAGLGGNSSGALLPAASSDEVYGGRRGSAMGGPVESFLASAFVPFLTISPPPTLSPCSPSQPPPMFAPSSSPLSSRSLLESPYQAASPYYTNNSSSPSPYPSNSPSPIPHHPSNSHLAHPALSSFAQFGAGGISSSSSESSYPYPSSSSRMSLQSFAIM